MNSIAHDPKPAVNTSDKLNDENNLDGKNTSSSTVSTEVQKLVNIGRRVYFIEKNLALSSTQSFLQLLLQKMTISQNFQRLEQPIHL